MKNSCLSIVVATAALVACSAHSTTSSTGPKPVPECQAYEREMARCTGTEANIATQPAALAQDDADRDRLAAICSSNLERLRQSCR